MCWACDHPVRLEPTATGQSLQIMQCGGSPIDSRRTQGAGPMGSGAYSALLLRQHLELDHTLHRVLPVLTLQSLGAADDGEDEPAEAMNGNNQPKMSRPVTPPNMATSTNAIGEISWKLNDLAASYVRTSRASTGRKPDLGRRAKGRTPRSAPPRPRRGPPGHASRGGPVVGRRGGHRALGKGSVFARAVEGLVELLRVSAVRT